MFNTLLDEVSKDLDLPALPYRFKLDDRRRIGLRMTFTSDVPVLHAHTAVDIGFLTDAIWDFRERCNEPWVARIVRFNRCVDTMLTYSRHLRKSGAITTPRSFNQKNDNVICGFSVGLFHVTTFDATQHPTVAASEINH